MTNGSINGCANGSGSFAKNRQKRWLGALALAVLTACSEDASQADDIAREEPEIGSLRAQDDELPRRRRRDAGVPDAQTPADAQVSRPDATTPPDAQVSAPDAQVSNPPSGTPPALTRGVWKNITPAGVNLQDGCCTSYPNQGYLGNTFGVTWVEIDPSNPYTLYTTVDAQGLWKSSDGGTSWRRLGTPPPAPTYATTVSYLESPFRVRVDPRNPRHLYATSGVRGNTLGFWVSNDGGETWSQPPGFVSASRTATNDVTTMVVDPSNFDHVLIGSHSPWANNTSAGLMETKDGGNTFTLHPAQAGWPVAGSLGIAFLFEPSLNIGNAQTWLVSVENGGFYRTENGGQSWTRVSSPKGAIHGGTAELYFARNGAIYSGANNTMLRSTDRGLTWTAVGPTTQDGFYQVIGDGNVLYGQPANTGWNTTTPQPYFSSPESDGVTWTAYQGGAQTFRDGPNVMRFDSVNRILYSANWRAGLWALKVLN